MQTNQRLPCHSERSEESSCKKYRSDHTEMQAQPFRNVGATIGRPESTGHK